MAPAGAPSTVVAGEPLHVGIHAERTPDKPAAVHARTRVVRTFAELDERSARLAHVLAEEGLEEGGRVAVLLPNVLEYFDAAWAVQRSGLRLVPVNRHLTGSEIGYLVGDCGAQALITSIDLAERSDRSMTDLAAPGLRLCLDGRDVTGFDDLEDRIDQATAEPLRPETEGASMFYSSGTTGRPKGIVRAGAPAPYGTPQPLDERLARVYGFDRQSVYLCPAPLYHAAPLSWSMGTQRLGGTVVVMDRFDPVEALALIEEFGVTHVQMVPTMFVRLLKLKDDQRRHYDLSSLQTVVHAAAPCPVDVKQQMVDWLGPIVFEYYSSSEGYGVTSIGPDEWRTRPGSVGRPLTGAVHILDDLGGELPAGEVGTVYFEGGAPFSYHNDPEKTAGAYNDRGWATIGDMGWVDPDGYLYLSERRTNLVISGGVNIYPQEVEDALALHPSVLDVAVIGVPDAEMGEQLKAVVRPADPEEAGPGLEELLIEFCHQRLARYKCPRSVDFVDTLPRLPTGKMAKHLLVERYQTFSRRALVQKETACDS